MGPLKIFICYRREDGEGHAGRLSADLRRHFRRKPSNYFRLGAEIIRDVDNIPAGTRWLEYIQPVVESCDVMIAIIGRQWLNIADEAGLRRIDDPKDTLSLELSTALSRDIRVIPCLVQGATIPKAKDLPASLKELPLHQGFELSDPGWDEKVDRLIRELEGVEHLGAPNWTRPPLASWVKTTIFSVSITLASTILALILYLLFKGSTKLSSRVEPIFSIVSPYLLPLLVIGIISLVLVELLARRLKGRQLHGPKSTPVNSSHHPNRRTMILGLTIATGAVAGITAFAKVILPFVRSTDSNFKKTPRFMKNKKTATSADVGLKEGIYAEKYTGLAANAPVTAVSDTSKLTDTKGSTTTNPNGRVNTKELRTNLHFVDAKGRIPFVEIASLRVQQLKPVGPNDLKLLSPTARLFPKRVSAVCELAAASYLRNKEYDKAAEILIFGIKQDLDSKMGTSFGVSLRLYDLLARVIVRHGLQQYYSTLLELATKAREFGATQSLGKPAQRKRRKQTATDLSKPSEGVPGVIRTRAGFFDTRIKNWSTKDGIWWKRQTDKTRPVTWSMTAAPDTSKGRNAIDYVTI